MFSIPAAFVFGVAGIIRDKTKWLAIAATIISGGLILWYMYIITMANVAAAITGTTQ